MAEVPAAAPDEAWWSQLGGLWRGLLVTPPHHSLEAPPPLEVLSQLLQHNCMGDQMAALAAAVISRILFFSPAELQSAAAQTAMTQVSSLPAYSGLRMASTDSHIVRSLTSLVASREVVTWCLELIKGACEGNTCACWVYVFMG